MWYASEIRVWSYPTLSGLSGFSNILRAKFFDITALLLHFEKDVGSLILFRACDCSYKQTEGLKISFTNFFISDASSGIYNSKLDLTSKTKIPLSF